MGKYLAKRVLHGLLSIMAVVAIVMVMIYTLMDRNLIFSQDPLYTKLNNNQKATYRYSKWEEYGYIDYVPYTDWLTEQVAKGAMTDAQRTEVASFGRTADADTAKVKEAVAQFTADMQAKGYEVLRLPAVMATPKKVANGGQQALFAYKNRPLITRFVGYITGIISHDNIHYVKEDIENRGLTFTLYDPVYGGKKFSPALMGNGTQHRYLIYFDNQFPYFHQNLFAIRLGTSYTVNMGTDVFDTMTSAQGSYISSTITYPTGDVEVSADNLHSATYLPGSREASLINQTLFTDDYTNVTTMKRNMSKVGFSFVIGLISQIIVYLLGVPLGVVMARQKDKLIDQIGTVYIVFIIAVPSLAYIFLFKAIGNKIGLPSTFDMESNSKLMFILPIVSLALPAIANLMKWLRRYMIDQMNSDYVKFARSGGLSEGEIFTKHILKNAAIPIIHGIPANVLGALVGAIITERVYVVPGAGNLLTQAINTYDNGVIVGVTLFYAVLSVTSIILGDVLMAMVDPRISFTSKAR